MIKPTKQDYLHYNNQWYDIQPMEVIIKHITEGINVIDISEEERLQEQLNDQIQLNNELEDIIQGYNNN